MSPTPPRVRTTHLAGAADYRDEMVLSYPGADERPAVEWARDIIERSPAWIRWGLPPGWRVLGMKLSSPHAPDRVHGWPVVLDTPARVVLAAPSRFGFDARLAVDVDPEEVRFTTAIAHGGRVSRPLWTLIGGLHRATIGHMLRHAVATAD